MTASLLDPSLSFANVSPASHTEPCWPAMRRMFAQQHNTIIYCSKVICSAAPCIWFQVFLTHLHSDHIADLATFYVGAMFGRTQPWEVWGPSSEQPDLGLNASIAGLRQVPQHAAQLLDCCVLHTHKLRSIYSLLQLPMCRAHQSHGLMVMQRSKETKYNGSSVPFDSKASCVYSWLPMHMIAAGLSDCDAACASLPQYSAFGSLSHATVLRVQPPAVHVAHL